MRVTVDGDKATALCRPTPAILALLPRMEGPRRWLKGGGLSFKPSGHNLELFAALGAEIDILTATPFAEAFAPDLPLYKPKTEPYPHQLQARAKIGHKPTFALFIEQGLGKTKIAIDWAGELFSTGRITGMLVVSKKGVHRQWIESEFPHHYGGELDGEFHPLKGDRHWSGSGLKVFAINYDALRTKTGFDAAFKFCKSHKGKLLIVADESQEIRNHNSARSEAMAKLATFSSHRLLLTGTPVAKDLTDEWAQLKWLNPDILGIDYITTFRSEYCLMGGFQLRSVVGAKNVDRFREKVDPWTFRVTKEEVGLLPKQYNEWVFDLTPQQRKLIKEAKQELLIRLDSGQEVTVHEAVGVLSKVQQISNGFVMDNEGIACGIIPDHKNPRVLALLEWIEAQDDRVIIWLRYRHDAVVLELAMRAAGHKFVRYYGGVPDTERQEAVASFTRPGGARVFLGNPQSAGTGLNLQGTSNRVAYYSNSFNSIDRWQSEDRNHRIGTFGTVTYTDFIGRGGIDRHIVSNLRRKKGVAEMAIGEIKSLLGDENDL